jgi:prophage regulatory protein
MCEANEIVRKAHATMSPGRGTYHMSDRFLRVKQVCGKVGWSRGTLYAEVKAGRFPQPRQLGVRAIAFLESEVDEFIRSRPIADPKIHAIGHVNNIAKRRKSLRDAQLSEASSCPAKSA